MKKIKPLFLVNDESLSELEKNAAKDGIESMISLTGLNNLIELKDFGVWREKGYQDKEGRLKEFKSVDWYLAVAKKQSRNSYQFNAQTIINLFALEPWREQKDHYDVLISPSDMYAMDANFLIGAAVMGLGAVISTDKFKTLDDWMRYECIKTNVMHELGHVFGLIPPNRQKNVETSLGTHCTDKCIMRQGLILPDDFVNITKDRLNNYVLCDECKKDIVNYFK